LSQAVFDDFAQVGCVRLRAKVGEDPGGARLAPRVEVDAGLEIND
jgi:hypothetical protein